MALLNVLEGDATSFIAELFKESTYFKTVFKTLEIKHTNRVSVRRFKGTKSRVSDIFQTTRYSNV